MGKTSAVMPFTPLMSKPVYVSGLFFREPLWKRARRKNRANRYGTLHTTERFLRAVVVVACALNAESGELIWQRGKVDGVSYGHTGG